MGNDTTGGSHATAQAGAFVETHWLSRSAEALKDYRRNGSCACMPTGRLSDTVRPAGSSKPVTTLLGVPDAGIRLRGVSWSLSQ